MQKMLPLESKRIGLWKNQKNEGAINGFTNN